MIIGPKRII